MKYQLDRHEHNRFVVVFRPMAQLVIRVLCICAMSGTLLACRANISAANNGEHAIPIANTMGSISHMAYSSNGQTLAFSGSKGVALYSVPTFTQLWFRPSSFVESLTFSPDDSMIAALQSDRNVYILQGKTGAVITMLENAGSNSYTVPTIAFSPDGNLLASGDDDGNVRIWQVHGWSVFHDLAGYGQGIVLLDFSSDSAVLIAVNGARLASAPGFPPKTMVLRRWELPSGALLSTIIPTRTIDPVGITQGGSLLLGLNSGNNYNGLRFWHVSSTNLENEESVDNCNLGYGRQGIFSQNEAFFAITTSASPGVEIYRVAGSDDPPRFMYQTSKVSTIAISPDNRTLVGVTTDAVLHIWPLELP